VPGAQLDGVHYLRTAADAERIRTRLNPGSAVTVVGAGFIGLEVAASARAIGCEVTVLEAAESILSRVLPDDLGTDVATMHRDHGVRIDTGACVKALEGSEAVERVRLGDGSSVTADAVIVGVGVAPNTELAEAAGIPVDDGILTDARGRTSTPGVYAIGDCACSYRPRCNAHVRLESHQNALLQAESVAHELLGRGADHDPVPWLWSDQFDWTLQVAGFPNAASRFVRRGAAVNGSVLHLGYDDRDRLVGAAVFGNTPAAARDLRLVQRMMEAGRDPDPERVGDESVSMKKIWKGAA
jgi:3-phenylpropionate/trans-cinnamate dioxygenase ferredoxin reductase subunit